MAIINALAVLLALIHITAALQVTPGSPCSSVCLDEPDLDDSDPESSNTTPDDIVCNVKDFISEAKGQKFQRCLNCLQDSGFEHGHESDQQWFFYNLRFAVNYCVLGNFNATDVEAGPCATKESCGALDKALSDGLLEPAHSEAYDYCDASNSVVLSSYMEDCVTCVHSFNPYMANFLTAIQAGCEQKPLSGTIVGLNETIFTTNTILITEPSTTSSADTSTGPVLSPPMIAGVAIGGVILILLIAGCVYMQIRRRRNMKKNRRASPLEFRCQTHVTPLTAEFPPGVGEKPFVCPSAALGSNPPERRLTSIVTTTPPMPAKAAASPRLGEYTTPTSTTSMRSNAPLLSSSYRPYVPAEYGMSGTPGLAITTTERSPYQGFPSPRHASFAEQSSLSPQQNQTVWEQPESGRTLAVRDMGRRKNTPATNGSPTSMTNIQTSFPPPPSGRR